VPLVRRQTFLILYGGLALCVAALYFTRFPIPYFFLRFKEFAAVALFAAAAAALGERAFAWARWPVPDEGKWGWRFGAGAALLSLAFLGLGVLGFYRPLPLALVVIAALAVAWRGAVRLSTDFRFFVAGPPSPPSAWNGTFLAGAAGTVLILTVLCALAPPTYYDSLVYHLALPAKYLQEGRVGFVPYNHYSHFPQNMELVFGWFLAVGDDVAAQLFCVLCAAGVGLLLARAGRSFFPDRGFRWDLLFFISSPAVVLLSSETYVELPLALWTTLALLAAAKGLTDGDRRWFLLAGFFGGFATGIKYTGGLTPALLAALIFFWPDGRSWKTRFFDAGGLSLAAFLTFLPWLVKNAVFTGGNPVFPFLPGVFPAKNVYMFEESSRAYFQVLDEYKGTSSVLVELILMPLRLAANPLSFGGGFDVTGDLGWVLPLLLLPLALGLSGWWKNRTTAFLSAYAVLHILLWACMRPVLRFLIPVFPLICLLAGAGAARLQPLFPAWGRGIFYTLVALLTLSNAVLFYWAESVRNPFPAAFGVMDRDEYLSRKLDAYPAWRFMDRELPPDSRVFFVGDQRGYYSPRPYLAPMALLPNPLKEWADAAGDGPALRRKLLELRFTHLFFNRREAERLKSYRVLDLTDKGRAAWEAMLRELPVVYQTPDQVIFRLTP